MTSRNTVTTTAIAFLAMIGFAGSAVAVVEPVLETFTDEHVARVRAQAEASRHIPMEEREDVEGMANEAARWEAMESAAARLPGPIYDNDASHYARGTTLILHVFIDHLGGSWEFDERQEAGARASLAKQYYLDNAPSNAHVRFDNEGSSVYVTMITSVPYDLSAADELEGWVIEEAIDNFGYVDGDGDGEVTDDFTLSLQGWNGGWNNLIACFQLADVDGRAWANYGPSYTKLYRNSGWDTWAHEWGHLFGACDEYEEGGSCNGGNCASECQGKYLNDTVPNGNCELCTGLATCLMKYNTTTNLCAWTPRNWAWVDGDGNGQLDRTLRRDTSNNYFDIWELYHNGWMIHTNTNWGMVAPQRWTSWSAIGVRGRGTADYDMHVYADSNRFHPLASSTYNGSAVDFVVGDFNHNKLMHNHVELDLDGGAGQYVLSYESGNGMLYPDGVERNFTWDALNVVRTYDVPLFGGETVWFLLDMNTAALDMGMALYSSNGTVFYSGRSGYEHISDFPIPGDSESFTFDVPEDDVYGLVVWANTEVDGNFSIQIGPSPLVLAEETPFTSVLDLRLYTFVPDVPYWAVAAARPAAGTNVTLKLAENSTYQTILATSGAYPNVEFIAADYHPGQSTDYLRTIRTGGAGNHTTEWEQSADILTGFDTGSIPAPGVCRVWDVYLRGGQPYFFRQYNEGGGADLDCGIYAISSADGDRYTQRSGADAGSNSHPPADLGEWFTYTPPSDDWYGAVMIKNDESDGQYSMGVGPRIVLAPGVPERHPEEIFWSSFEVPGRTWSIAAVRPDGPSTSSVALWDCGTYGSECWITYDGATSGVQFMAIDGHTDPAGTDVLYPRFRRESGSDDMTISFDPGGRDLDFDDETEVVSGAASFVEGEVAHIWNLELGSGLSLPIDATIRVTPDDTDLDLGIFVLDGSGSWSQSRGWTIVEADGNGPGQRESLVATFATFDVHAIVVIDAGGTGGRYDLELWQESTLDAAADGQPPIAAVALTSRSANPMRTRAVFDVALPEAGRVEVGVYDLGGRFVRSLASGELARGVHSLSWDGRDTFGRETGAGVYLVRLQAAGEVRSAKVLRAER